LSAFSFTSEQGVLQRLKIIIRKILSPLCYKSTIAKEMSLHERGRLVPNCSDAVSAEDKSKKGKVSGMIIRGAPSELEIGRAHV
jgi:hypothetical protein